MNEEKTNVKETKTSNKVLLFILVVVAIALIVVGIVYATRSNEPKSNVTIESAEDMENLINQVYEGQTENLPGSLMTQAIDINDANILKSYTGLDSNENIDAVVVSEPMMSSQAYSFVLVKVKDGADADAVAKTMSEQVDTRKWICVEAEKLYATSVDNIAVLVMASDEWATPVYNKLIEILGAHNEEYTKDNSSVAEPQQQELIPDNAIATY